MTEVILNIGKILIRACSSSGLPSSYKLLLGNDRILAILGQCVSFFGLTIGIFDTVQQILNEVT